MRKPSMASLCLLSVLGHTRHPTRPHIGTFDRAAAAPCGCRADVSFLDTSMEGCVSKTEQALMAVLVLFSLAGAFVIKVVL